jgi:GT2 family glycosyltransferase
VFSYGGKDDKGPVLPNGKIQNCKYINGNIVLVSKQIYQRVGNLSNDYTHSYGDYDYGLRARNEGFRCCTTRKYIALCRLNMLKHQWKDHNVPLSKRIQLFNSPKGLNYKEYKRFRKNFWGVKWIEYSFKAYFKLFFPRFFNKSN